MYSTATAIGWGIEPSNMLKKWRNQPSNMLKTRGKSQRYQGIPKRYQRESVPKRYQRESGSQHVWIPLWTHWDGIPRSFRRAAQAGRCSFWGHEIHESEPNGWCFQRHSTFNFEDVIFVDFCWTEGWKLVKEPVRFFSAYPHERCILFPSWPRQQVYNTELPKLALRQLGRFPAEYDWKHASNIKSSLLLHE